MLELCFYSFDIFLRIFITLCISLPNFMQVGPPTVELWRYSRWRLRQRISTSGFVFRDFAQLGRSKSTCRPNFGEISQSTTKILLLPVSENKRPPYWNSTPGFDFRVCVIIGMSFCICLSNFVKIGSFVTKLRRNIHF